MFRTERASIYRKNTTLVKKTLLRQGISEPIFYGDLVNKFKRIVGKPNFSDQFKKITKRYKKLDIIWISCDSLHAFFVNPFTVYRYYMVSSLIARCWVRSQPQRQLWRKALICWLVPDAWM